MNAKVRAARHERGGRDLAYSSTNHAGGARFFGLGVQAPWVNQVMIT